jgi:hypothetical protein
MTHKFLGFAILFALAFTSCKKDATFTETLIGNTWKLTASTFDEDGTGPIAAVSDLDDCDKDNTYVFKTDKTATINLGAIKCDPTDPATETASWALTADEKTFTLIPTSFPIALAYTIVSFSDSEIKLSAPDLFGTGGVSNETWTKQ